MITSCIIPAYNEELTVGKMLALLKKISFIDELIVVDDGSSDNTFDVASRYAKVIRHKKNKGKGAAMKSGIKSAKGDIILFLDADLQHIGKTQISRLKSMVNIIKKNKADVVIGTFDFECFQTFTELIYKPLMGMLFPEVLEKIPHGFLSGQRVIKRKYLDNITLRDGFDVETGMNIEWSFLKKIPRITFVHLGKISPRPKGYQKNMGIIADCILMYAKKYNRLHRIKNSSFKKISSLLYDKMRVLK